MTAVPEVVSLLAISAALMLSGSHVFAKSGSGPSQVKTSGKSAAPSGATGGQAKFRRCYHRPCRPYPGDIYQPPGHTQPPCRGPHRGPNGVMIQCD